MEAASKTQLAELQSIVSKLSLDVVIVSVVPELGIQWKQLAQAVRNARLPMTAASVAKILKQYIVKMGLPAEHVEDIIAQLRIKLLATSGSRVWHTIKLEQPTFNEEPVESWARLLPSRIIQAARKTVRAHNKRTEVHSSKIGDFVFISLQLVSQTSKGATLYVAALPNEPVAFVTTLGSSSLIQAAVEGLGYKKFTNAFLYGRDLMSLLKIIDRTFNVNMNHLTELPEYAPKPVITKNSIDYTNKTYNEQYVDNIIGPDPPLLNNLDIQSRKPFFNPAVLDKSISVKMTLKSDDVAKTLKSWVAGKVIAPTSEFFQVFHQIKSNRLDYYLEDDD